MGAVLVFVVSAARTYADERQHFVFVAHIQAVECQHFVFVEPIHAVKGSHTLRVEGGALVATAVAKYPSHK